MKRNIGSLFLTQPKKNDKKKHSVGNVSDAVFFLTVYTKSKINCQKNQISIKKTDNSHRKILHFLKNVI